MTMSTIMSMMTMARMLMMEMSRTQLLTAKSKETQTTFRHF